MFLPFLEEQDEVQKDSEHQGDQQQYHGVQPKVDAADIQRL